MWRELLATFEDVAADRNDRVMVLTGAGDAFCSGADLGEPSDVAGRPGDPYLLQMRALGDVALRLHRIPKPTIAKVGGIAAGAGMSMALGCDLVVASETARFSQIFAKRGLSIDFGASWLLPRLDRPAPCQGAGLLRRHHRCRAGGRARAGQPGRAAGPARRVGGRWARRLAAGPPLALSMTKTMLNNSFTVSLDQAVEEESRVTVRQLRQRSRHQRGPAGLLPRRDSPSSKAGDPERSYLRV